MTRTPGEHLDGDSVGTAALEVHARMTPLDAHLDTMMASWLFGLDMKQNLRGIWRPTRRRLLHLLFQLLVPKGNHMPLFGHADIPRLIEGGFGGACLAGHAILNNLTPSFGRPWKKIEEQYAYLKTLEADDDRVEIARTPAEFRSVVARKKIAAIFAVEGVHCLGPVVRSNTRERLARLVGLRTGCGAAYITVNHFAKNDVATPGRGLLRNGDPDVGAGRLAPEFVEQANHVGLVIDLAHTNRQGILDICRMSSKPVMATHAGAFGAMEDRCGKFSHRMLHDKSIAAIRATGGCVGVLFSPYFLHGKQRDGDLDLVVRHYEWLVDVAGHEHVCLGTDFDGALTSIPSDMRDAADLPLLTNKLLARGWVESEIDALYSGNFLRVWEENEPAAASGEFPEDP